MFYHFIVNIIPLFIGKKLLGGMELKKALLLIVLLQGAVALELAVGVSRNDKKELLLFSCQEQCIEAGGAELGRGINRLLWTEEGLWAGTNTKIDSQEVVLYGCNGDCQALKGARIGASVLSIAVGDTDGDGEDEVVVGTVRDIENEELLVFDCSGDTCLLESSADLDRDVNAVCVGEVDGSGNAEVIAGTAHRLGKEELLVYDCSGSYCIMEKSHTLSAEVNGLVASDLDKDGNEEIIAGTALKSGAPEIMVLDCRGDCRETGGMEMTFNVNELLIADVDGDGESEVVAGMEIHSSKPELQVLNCSVEGCEVEATVDMDSSVTALAFSDGLLWAGTSRRLDGPEAIAFDCADSCQQVREVTLDQDVLSLAAISRPEAEESVEVETVETGETAEDAEDDVEGGAEEKAEEGVEEEVAVEERGEEAIEESEEATGDVKETEKRETVSTDVSYDVKGSVAAVLIMAGLLTFILPKMGKR